jgi:hypothetical protein
MIKGPFSLRCRERKAAMNRRVLAVVSRNPVQEKTPSDISRPVESFSLTIDLLHFGDHEMVYSSDSWQSQRFMLLGDAGAWNESCRDLPGDFD